MKRIKVEQLQTTTLLYLKKRNFTDSEITFRHNFKATSSPYQTASSLIKNNLLASFDVVAMMTQNLDEYFYAFKSLQDFINNTGISESTKYAGLKKILFPVFIHAYLDLVIAGRQKEAKEFYTLFHDEKLASSSTGILIELEKVKEPDDVQQVDTINQIRSKTCQISLSSEEKQLFMQFLHSQDNLVIMKIINERFCFGDSKELSMESITLNDILKMEQDKVLPTSHQQELSSHMQDKEVKDDHPCNNSSLPELISPPTSYPSVPTPNSSQVQTPEKVMCHVVVDKMILKKQIRNVRSYPPSVQGLSFFKFEDRNKSITNVSISNDRKIICSSREDSSLTLWDVSHSIKPASIEASSDFAKNENNLSSEQYPDVSFVIFGSEFEKDVFERARVATRKRKHQLNYSRVTALLGHSGPVYSSSFTHDDKYLLSCSEDTTIRLWDLDRLNNRTIYFGHNYPVLSLAVSALSFYFASGSMDHTCRLWSLERTYPVRIFAGHEHSVETVAFHGNASYLASADNTVRLWDINSGKTVRLLVGHWAPVTCIAFSPDGKYLASSGEDCRIRIVDIGNGNLLKEIRYHTDTVYSLNFSSDSSMLVSCSADTSVCVWNVLSSITENDLASKEPSQMHVVAKWMFENSVDKILFSQFTGDIVNCIGVV